MTNTTRRAILAGATAVGAMTGAAAGVAITTAADTAAGPDPIFDLIERHRAAYDAHGVACLATDAEEIGSAEYYAAEAAQYVAGKADCDALRALVRTVPTTAAGVVAVIRYLLDYEHLGNSLRPIHNDLIGTMLQFAEART